VTGLHTSATRGGMHPVSKEIAGRALDRRGVLALALASAALESCSTLGGQPKPQPLPFPVSNFVDAHCHIFNAADVPAAGFIIHVAAREYGFEEYKSVVAFFVSLLVGAAPSPQAEEQKLTGRNLFGLSAQPAQSDVEFEGKVLTALNALADGATVDEAPEQDLSPAAATLPDEPEVRQLKRHRIPVSPQDFRIEGRRANSKAVALHYLLQKYGPGISMQSLTPPPAPGAAPARNAPLFRRLRNTLTLSTLARSLAAKAQSGSSGTSLFDRFMVLARIFLDYRAANLHALDRVFGKQSGATARLYCPATIDYDAWVVDADAPQTSALLTDQATVIAQIARDSRTDVLLNGYIAFDPLRAAIHKRTHATGPSPLDVVKDALSLRGFAGVKLYPPMGFRPWDNAAITDGFGPNAARLAPGLHGSELDDVLAEVYRFCLQNDVPILAHCSNSQTSFEGAGERAAPQYWEQLLSTAGYANLRVNLGHFGSFWCEDTNRTRGSDEDARCQAAKAWPAYILGMLSPDSSGRQKYPNLYFDIADIGDLAREPYRTQLLTYLDAHLPTDAQARSMLLSRLLYGTDWMFLVMDQDVAGFAVATENLAHDSRFNISVDDLLWRNALHFLGLKDGAQTATRLRAFYAGDTKHLTLLNQLVLPA
jgi:predicted TIM-barrel fold metal-dependent hydrolase